jgi:hypothetical protein
MATRNYLIGIGGTGARVIEAVVNLCAAGLGPDELSMFVVDPDAGNGNLDRTKKLITEYKNCRNKLQKTESCPLFKTDIKIPPGEKEFVWEIFSNNKATLSDFINFTNMKSTNPDLSDFASLLFTENELNEKLDEGFRGHPSIGAVVMSNPPQDKYPFKMLWEEMNDKRPNEIRVFIVGSVFGGTGAAGFPTLGSKKLIKFNENAKIGEKESKVLLGGALVLPYFSFEIDSETTEKMFVTANDFPIATKAALQYYNEKDLGFDQIYFIGDSLGQKVGKFGVGSGKQSNMPHYVEIVSSLAAFDFFEQAPIVGIPEKMLFTATRESDIVKWNQLPFSRNTSLLKTKQINFKTAITNMTVLAYAFCTYGIKILNTPHNDIKDAWYRDHFKFKNNDEKEKEKDPRNVKIDGMENFLKKFLFWITAIEDDSLKVELIDRKMIIDGFLDPSRPFDFKLTNPESPVTKNNIGNVLKKDQTKNLDFNSFKTRGLDEVRLTDAKVNEAYSKLINIFYDATVRFNKLNYNFN